MWEKEEGKEMELILADGIYQSLDDRKTKRNSNVAVLGSPGSGKTTGVVLPNILAAKGSYVVTDPKGRLYDQTKSCLEKQGYCVKKIDFTQPTKSHRYNPFSYIHTEQDVLAMARMLAFRKESISVKDPFWNEACVILYSSLISYLKTECPERMQSFRNLSSLIALAQLDNQGTCELDQLFRRVEEKKGETLATRQYKKFNAAASRTRASILITANAQLVSFENEQLNELLSGIDEIDITSIGERKTALFVVVSDTDRSCDGIANLFFAQCFRELTWHADHECKGRLPIAVRFIMDDFATNVVIDDWDKLICSMRSRAMSAMIILQSESQLRHAYGEAAGSILSAFDNYIYLGGNDLETAEAVAKRCNVPLNEVLNLPLGKCWIMRRAMDPVQANLYPLELERCRETIEEKGGKGFWKSRKQLQRTDINSTCMIQEV